MPLITAFIIITVASIVLAAQVSVRAKGFVVLSAVALNTLLSGYFAISTLSGQSFEFIFRGSIITGPVPLRIDALSGWFIFIINFIFITGCIYGMFYMKAYGSQKNKLSLHAAVFILLHSSLLSLCAVQNGLVFLFLWEIMTLSAAIAVIFEHEKTITIKAGINYIIQSHFAIVVLMIGFIWVAYRTGSYDFAAVSQYSCSHPGAASLMLFLLFFTGFAIKAGFVPFHTWLPYAHPAAPSHISGIMSGVLIKIGIFGILRFLLLIIMNYTHIGFIILVISVISGLYGVMLAILQHNLKKLLAYHSIENIGIIGMGIGIGCIGLGSGNVLMAFFGFAGALLHTLNHALFKSLLFFTAGIVYQSIHTLDIERMGGLVKKLPHTAMLFLAASIAICGIPPFNGFISEFLIYSGLYHSLQHSSLVTLLIIIFSVLGLVLIGGLAMLCFTKAFGTVFLGTPRSSMPAEISEAPLLQRVPLFLIAALMLFIGLFPSLFIQILGKPVLLFTGEPSVPETGALAAMQTISRAASGFLILTAALYLLRIAFARKRSTTKSPTWGCGYTGQASKMQYTASSFVRTYSKLFSAFFDIHKKEQDVIGVFPQVAGYETHPYDRVEKYFIDGPIRLYRLFLRLFTFLQNGKLQMYILYGIIFIVLVICIPLFFENMLAFISFLKKL